MDRHHCHSGHNFQTLDEYIDGTYLSRHLQCEDCGSWTVTGPDDEPELRRRCDRHEPWHVGVVARPELVQVGEPVRRCLDCHATITLPADLLWSPAQGCDAAHHELIRDNYFDELEPLGVQRTFEGGPELELANCRCGTTLSRELPPSCYSPRPELESAQAEVMERWPVEVL